MVLGLWKTARAIAPITYPSFLYTIVSMPSGSKGDKFILLVITKEKDRESRNAVDSNEQAPLLKLVSHAPS